MRSSNRGIVTPEAVVLEFETAGVGSRAMAWMVDLMVLAGMGVLVGMVLGLVSVALPEAATIVGILLAALIFLGYPIFCETLFRGRTIGKRAMGLRVVTTDGAPEQFRHAALRALIGLVELWATVGFVAVTCGLSTRRSQRFGDLAAGTFVVRERSSTTRMLAVAFPPPPGYEQYTASLDVSSVNEPAYLVIRSFLLRVFDFTPSARVALATRLANPTAAAMHHTPPASVNPEVFLACVASAYQQRHGGLLVPTWHAPQWQAPPGWAGMAPAPVGGWSATPAPRR